MLLYDMSLTGIISGKQG